MSDQLSGPLAGLRVIDLTSVVMGPYATQFLGDFGADVIKVEAPKGDVIRYTGPAHDPSMGPMFLHSNRSKRSIVINLKQPAGRDLLLRLCRDADILVYNVRPAAMARLGLSYKEVAAVNPRLIYAGMFGYGQNGPYAARPAYDDLIQGGSGMAHLFSISGNAEPRYVPTAIADRVVGLTGAMAILAAVIARQTTGRGQQVDIPMFETMSAMVLADHMSGLTYRPPLDNGGYARQLAVDRRPLPTADGYVCALIYTDEQWRRFLNAIDDAARIEQPEFRNYTTRSINTDYIYGWLTQEFQRRTTAEWIALLDEIDVPVMTMHTLTSIFEDPHLQATGFFQPVEHPTEGPIYTVANPIQMSDTPIAPSRLAPNLGEHSHEILRDAGLDQEEIATLQRDGVIKES